MQGLEAEHIKMTNTPVNSTDGGFWVYTVSLLGPSWSPQPYLPSACLKLWAPHHCASWTSLKSSCLCSCWPFYSKCPSCYQTSSSFDIVPGVTNSWTLVWLHLPPSSWNRSCVPVTWLYPSLPLSHVLSVLSVCHERLEKSILPCYYITDS